MERLNSKEIADVLFSVSNVVNVDVDRISTDSRNIIKGDLFIAIRGEVFDGHNHVEEAITRGAEVVVVEKLLPNVATVRQIVVSDSRKAYAQLGKYVRDKICGKVIALTGSAGKTTTKELLRLVFSKFGSTYASVGNYNNDIGVPKSLCELSSDVEFGIFEIGTSAKGEISNLVSYVKPDVALVTNIHPMHIEFFKDLEEIAHAKAEIFKTLSKKGIAVINEDANYFEVLLEAAKKRTKNIVTYGKKNIISVVEKETSSFVEAKIGETNISFEISEIGEHHVYNALAVLSVVYALDLDLDLEIAARSLIDFSAVEGRGKKHKLCTKEGKKYVLIDDSYSGQPESMKLAIQTFAKYSTNGRKIAILGKMAELGEHSIEEHIKIGKVISETNIDVVVGICPETKDILAQLDDKFEKHYFENNDGLEKFILNKLLQNNDIMLIKGARYSSKLYQTAGYLIENGVEK